MARSLLLWSVKYVTVPYQYFLFIKRKINMYSSCLVYAGILMKQVLYQYETA